MYWNEEEALNLIHLANQLTREKKALCENTCASAYSEFTISRNYSVCSKMIDLQTMETRLELVGMYEFLYKSGLIEVDELSDLRGAVFNWRWHLKEMYESKMLGID